MGCNLFDDLVTRLRRIPETRHNLRRKTVEVTNLLNIGQRPNYRKEPQTTAPGAGYGTGYGIVCPDTTITFPETQDSSGEYGEVQ